MAEIYVSTDIEADGPIPGPHSMLSFGSAAFTLTEGLISTFTANLELLPDAVGAPDTMKWWSKHQEAWLACRQNLCLPEKAMKDYLLWLKELPDRPIFVGAPLGFDFTFIYWYLIKFAGESPFTFNGIDVRTYAMAMLKTEYRETVKRVMPKDWYEDLPQHKHVALDDAIEQGMFFINMLRSNLADC